MVRIIKRQIVLGCNHGKHPIKISPSRIEPILTERQVIDLTAVGVDEACRRLFDGLRAAGLDPGDSFHWDPRRPPFPGLNYFDTEDAGIYFGREDGPDGKTLAVGYGGALGGFAVGGGVVLWDMAARKRLGDEPLAVKEGHVGSVAFNPDGRTIAAGYEDVDVLGGGVVLWDTVARKRLGSEPLSVKEGNVESVAFSRDGKTIAAGYGVAGVGGVVLWDVATRKRLVDEPLSVRKGDVGSVAFSPDGKTIAAGYGVVRGDDGGVVLWDVDLESWLRQAGRIANRNFTRDEWQDYFPETPYRATFPNLPVPPQRKPM